MTEQYLRDQLNKTRNHSQHSSNFDTLVNAYGYANTVHRKHSIEKVRTNIKVT